MSVRVQFREEVPHPERIREQCEKTASALEEEFPEATAFDVSISHDGESHEAHVHVTGKNVDCASSARHRTLADAVHEALERTRKQLRKRHDKKIFGTRRR